MTDNWKFFKTMLEISFKYFYSTEIVFFSKIEYEVIKVSCLWFLRQFSLPQMKFAECDELAESLHNFISP